MHCSMLQTTVSNVESITKKAKKMLDPLDNRSSGSDG